MMLSDVCLTYVCLSVAYISGLSREQRPRKTKIGIEVAVAHVTRDSDTIFKVRRSKVIRSTCLMGNKGITGAHILLCLALL